MQRALHQQQWAGGVVHCVRARAVWLASGHEKCLSGYYSVEEWHSARQQSLSIAVGAQHIVGLLGGW